MFNVSIKSSHIPGGGAQMSFYPNLCARKGQNWCFITNRENRWIVVFGIDQTILIERILKLPFFAENMPIEGIIISEAGDMFAARKDEKCFIWLWHEDLWLPLGFVPIGRELLYSISSEELETKQDGVIYTYRPKSALQPYSVPSVKWTQAAQRDAGEF